MSQLRDDLLAITNDDMSPIDTGLLLALVEMANEEGVRGELLAYVTEFMLERMYEPSINVQGKSLVVLQLLCDKSPGFVESAKGSADLIARTVELAQADAPDGTNAAQIGMLKDTAQQLLLLLGERLDVVEDASVEGGGFIIKRVARRANAGRQRVASGIGEAAGTVGGTVGGAIGGAAQGVGGVAGRAKHSVVGGVTMVGQGVAGTVTDAAGGIVEKTPLNKLTREKTIPEDGITKEQRGAAIRLHEIVMKHGKYPDTPHHSLISRAAALTAISIT